MSKPTILIAFLSLLLTSMTCMDPNKEHYYYTIFNASDYPIWVQESFAYPDTLYNCDIKPFYIPPHEPSNIEKLGISYEEILSYDKNNYLQLLVVDTAIIKKLSTIEGYCEQINSNHKVLKRYQLSLQDLENQNWIIYISLKE